jgi:O-acetyl-ADP-ribose deacetylase (regulator of RNase III)
MIIELDTNLLEYPLDGIIHQANAFQTMAGGIALRIKNKFPEAYEADLKTKLGDKSKLGTFSVAVLPSNYHIYNLYGQFNFGYGRMTNYEAVATGLSLIKQHASDAGLKKLGLPKFMGCRLGGGAWPVIKAIIDVEFADDPMELYICNYEG